LGATVVPSKRPPQAPSKPAAWTAAACAARLRSYAAVAWVPGRGVAPEAWARHGWRCEAVDPRPHARDRPSGGGGHETTTTFKAAAAAAASTTQTEIMRSPRSVPHCAAELVCDECGARRKPGARAEGGHAPSCVWAGAPLAESVWRDAALFEDVEARTARAARVLGALRAGNGDDRSPTPALEAAAAEYAKRGWDAAPRDGPSLRRTATLECDLCARRVHPVAFDPVEDHRWFCPRRFAERHARKRCVPVGDDGLLLRGCSDGGDDDDDDLGCGGAPAGSAPSLDAVPRAKRLRELLARDLAAFS